jgi:hypothetical protein
MIVAAWEIESLGAGEEERRERHRRGQAAAIEWPIDSPNSPPSWPFAAVVCIGTGGDGSQRKDDWEKISQNR